MIKKIFVYNFLYQFLIENSLQISIFCLINLLCVSYINSNSLKFEFDSRVYMIEYLLSAMLYLSLISVVLITTYYSFIMKPKTSIKEAINTKIIMVYEELGDKSEKIFFNAIYILRRLSIALILIFCYNYQGAQL